MAVHRYRFQCQTLSFPDPDPIPRQNFHNQINYPAGDRNNQRVVFDGDRDIARYQRRQVTADKLQFTAEFPQ